MKKLAKRFWYAVPLAAAILCILLVQGLQQLLHVKLRCVPMLMLSWWLLLSVLLVILVLRIRQHRRNRESGGQSAIGMIGNALLLAAAVAVMLAGIVFSVVGYMPEHVVVRNDIRMVAQVRSFLDETVSYYPYRNFLFCGSEEIGHEWYGNGGGDPLDGTQHREPQAWYFRDLDGNLLEQGGME